MINTFISYNINDRLSWLLYTFDTLAFLAFCPLSCIHPLAVAAGCLSLVEACHAFKPKHYGASGTALQSVPHLRLLAWITQVSAFNVRGKFKVNKEFRDTDEMHPFCCSRVCFSSTHGKGEEKSESQLSLSAKKVYTQNDSEFFALL